MMLQSQQLLKQTHAADAAAGTVSKINSRSNSRSSRDSASYSGIDSGVTSFAMHSTGNNVVNGNSKCHRYGRCQKMPAVRWLWQQHRQWHLKW